MSKTDELELEIYQQIKSLTPRQQRIIYDKKNKIQYASVWKNTCWKIKMEIKEIINKAKKEIGKHKGYITYDKILTDLSKSFVMILCKEFGFTTWSDIRCFIESNTTFEYDRNKIDAKNINDFIKGYDTQLEVE